MLKQAVVMLSTVALIGHASIEEPDFLVRFKGGIGVTPWSISEGTLVQNTVKGVPPAGPWRIADLSATVTTDGRIKVKGRGLLLAGGNRIGENANQSVFATLVCETLPPFVERNTTLTGVPLELNGDFRIDDTLTPLPSECASPVLLIRSSNSPLRVWFAAGIPVRGDDED